VAVAVRRIVGVGKDALTSVLCAMVNVGLGVRVGLAVGVGGIEGAQAPRSSKAAAAHTSFIPLFTVHRLPSEALDNNATATLWLHQRSFGKTVR
jgi:TctA family transporter